VTEEYVDEATKFPNDSLTALSASVDPNFVKYTDVLFRVFSN